MSRNLTRSNDYASKVSVGSLVGLAKSQVNHPGSVKELSSDSASHQFVFLVRPTVLFRIRARFAAGLIRTGGKRPIDRLIQLT